MAGNDKKPYLEPRREAPPPAAPGIVLEESPFDRSRIRTPVFWACILFAPVILGIVAALVNPPAPEKAGMPVQTVQPPQQALQAEPPAMNAPDANIRGMPQQKKLACDFNNWQGVTLSNTLTLRIAQLNRPYRIIPPGAPVTQDHNPARVNFELDKDGIITRIWCG